MYIRVITRFCNSIVLDRYPVVMIKRNELAVRTSYTYISVTDASILKCAIVASFHKPIGSIAVGQVIHSGVDVNDVHEGMRVALFPINSPYYLDTVGGAQEISVIDRLYVKPIEFKNYNDLEATIISALSVKKDIIDVIKGKEIAVVGNDLSLLPFAYYSSQYSSGLNLVAKYSKELIDMIKGGHISLYNSSKKFDVVVIASSDPMAVCLSVKNLASCRTTIVLYPYLSKLLNNICINGKDINIVTMSFGDMKQGIEIYEYFKELIRKEINVIELKDFKGDVDKPLFLKFR